MIPQLGQESEWVLHARHLGFVTVEKLQQIGIFQGFYRGHPHWEGVQLLWRKTTNRSATEITRSLSRITSYFFSTPEATSESTEAPKRLHPVAE